MDWDDLRIFDAAARAGSLGVAARRLGMSQPQVSRRLRGLEASLGARLFDRTPQGLRHTEAGRRLAALCAPMAEAADAIARATPQIAESGVTTVRLALDEVRLAFIGPALADLVHAAGPATLELHASHVDADHHRRATELQIRSCLPDSDTLVARTLGWMPYAVYAGRDLSVAGVEDGPWIALAETECWFLEVKTWIDGAAGPKVALRVNTITGAHEAARRGVGLAVLPMFIGDGDVALRRVSGPALRSRETLIAHRDLLREPAVRRVADALVAIYRRHERDAASRDDRGLAPAS